MSTTKNTIKILILVFFSFILVSIIQGYKCKFYTAIYCKNIFENYWEENGIIEYSQVVLLFLAICLLFSVRRFFYDNNKLLYYLLIIKIIGLIYFFGEEISWGQHIFNWETPDSFKRLNNQNETNIHNISNFFDQVPRTLVLLWCSFSIIIITFLNKLTKVNKLFFVFINPNRNIFLVSLLLIFFIAPDFIVDKFGLHPGHQNSLSYNEVLFALKKGLFSSDMPSSIFYDLISFNFLRLSELHELIIAFYFFIHSYSLKKKIRTIN